MRFLSLAILAAQLARAADVSLEGQDDRLLKVTAGEEIEVRVTNVDDVGIGYVGQLNTTHIQIGVVSMIDVQMMCTLTGYLPAKDGIVKVTIPPEIGPSGAYYKLGANGYSIKGEVSKVSVPENIVQGSSSNIVFLSGGKGHWTPTETMPELRYNGLSGFEEAEIPCKSYSCARDCVAKSFPDWSGGSAWVKCLSACDGVKLKTEESIGGSDPSPSVSVPKSLPTPSSSCSENDFKTPCATECCSSNEYCLYYQGCVPLPLNFAFSRGTTTSSDVAAPTSTDPTKSKDAESSNTTEEASDKSGSGEGAAGILKVSITTMALSFAGLVWAGWCNLG